MIPVPQVKDLDMAFGNISHLPKMKDIPDQFKMSFNTKHNKFISSWFFFGLTDEQVKKLKPKEGVDSTVALKAIASIMRSFEPQHEHKEAGCAYLLSEWFEEDSIYEK